MIITAIIPAASTAPMPPAMRSFFFCAAVRSRFMGFSTPGAVVSMRLDIMSSARIVKKMIVESAYIFGVTVFLVML